MSGGSFLYKLIKFTHWCFVGSVRRQLPAPRMIHLLCGQGCGCWGVSAAIWCSGVSEGWAQAHECCLLSVRQSLSSSDHGLGRGGEGARDQLPVNGESPALGPETDTDATGAVPAATAEVTDGGPETGVQNTSMYS